MNAGLRVIFSKSFSNPNRRSPFASKLLTALLNTHRQQHVQRSLHRPVHLQNGVKGGDRSIASHAIASSWEGDTRKVNIYAGKTKSCSEVLETVVFIEVIEIDSQMGLSASSFLMLPPSISIFRFHHI